MDNDGLGAKFWLAAVGAILAGAIGLFLLFAIVGAVWYSWGALGALVFFFGLMLAFGYIYDRTHTKSYENDDVNA